MPSEVRFTRSAAKELRKLPPEVRRRLRPVVDGLAAEPRPSGARKLVGSASLYRVRAGDYRVIYEVDEATAVVLVVRVRHRRDAYL